MTLRSMTGYGESAAEQDGVRATAVIRSVNHKQLDVRLAMPSALGAHETRLAEVIRARLGRGRIDVRVNIASTTPGGLSDPTLDRVGELVTTLRALEHRFELSGGISVADVLRAGGGSLLVGENEVPTDLAASVAGRAVEAALDELLVFREREGAGLHAFFAEVLAELTATLQDIERLATTAIAEHRALLSQRVADLLAGTASPMPDTDRLEQEIVLIAARSDIAEELQRAGAHVAALQTLIDQPDDTPAGKRIDFLLQELIRETNTMASKSVSAPLTHCVVSAKAAIERMREQAMNVE